MKKEIEICDKCKKNIAIGKCDICGSDVCKVHSVPQEVKFGNRLLAEFLFCYICFKDLGKEIENNLPVDNVKVAILEVLTKEIAMKRIK